MLHCDICTKTNNHCCKADIPLDAPIALALIEISGLTNLAITETPKFPGSVVIVDKRWFVDPKKKIPVDIQEKACVFFKKVNVVYMITDLIYVDGMEPNK